jgi:peptidoglycan hydrolase-like protein with peptidoglycan-binding domain
MKSKKSFLTATVIGGIIVVGTAPAIAVDESSFQAAARSYPPNERYPTQNSDDQSLAPGVPGVTEENNSGISQQEVQDIQRALEANGYDPGRMDGFMDNDTRAAIREFQKDNALVVTGSIDEKTAYLLGVT